jgi:hypothetical protein
MNERIDQLWGQALDLTVPETYSQLSHSQVLKIKQVFAELIVRECAKFMDENSGYDDSNNAWHPEPEDLLKHFGVEE